MAKVIVRQLVSAGPAGEVSTPPVLRWLDSLSDRQRDELAALLAGIDRTVLADCGVLGDWIEEHGGRRSFAGSLDVDLPKAPVWMVGELRRRTGLPVLECCRILEAATLAEYRRITGGIDRSHQVDPAEDDPAMATILLRASLEAEAELDGVDRGMGFDGTYCYTKQRILRERYGVRWQTPMELNPHIIFD